MDQTLSSPPPNSPSSKARAYTLSALFLTVSLSFVFTFSSEFRAATFAGWLTALRTSAWGLFGFTDYVLGAVFAAMYIWLRNGPPLFCIPSRVIAVLCPFLGSPLVLIYLAVLIVSTKSLPRAFLPRGRDQRNDAVFDEPANKRGSVTVLVVFAGLLVLYIGVIWRALVTESFAEANREFQQISYHYMTVWDGAIGLLLPCTVIIMREWGYRAALVGWLVGVAAMGNGVNCIYVMVLAWRSLKKDRLFADLLFSEEKGRN